MADKPWNCKFRGEPLPPPRGQPEYLHRRYFRWHRLCQEPRPGIFPKRFAKAGINQHDRSNHHRGEQNFRSGKPGADGLRVSDKSIRGKNLYRIFSRSPQHTFNLSPGAD